MEDLAENIDVLSDEGSSSSGDDDEENGVNPNHRSTNFVLPFRTFDARFMNILYETMILNYYYDIYSKRSICDNRTIKLIDDLMVTTDPIGRLEEYATIVINNRLDNMSAYCLYKVLKYRPITLKRLCILNILRDRSFSRRNLQARLPTTVLDEALNMDRYMWCDACLFLYDRVSVVDYGTYTMRNLLLGWYEEGSFIEGGRVTFSKSTDNIFRRGGDDDDDTQTLILDIDVNRFMQQNIGINGISYTVRCLEELLDPLNIGVLNVTVQGVFMDSFVLDFFVNKPF